MGATRKKSRRVNLKMKKMIHNKLMNDIKEKREKKKINIYNILIENKKNNRKTTNIIGYKLDEKEKLIKL